jgi:CDGSH-type Zn-finger protein
MASIDVRADGPYAVTGAPPITRRRIVANDDGDSSTWETTADLDTSNEVLLCRCGGSRNKPFCDASHASNGFAASDGDTGSYDERSKVLGGQQVTIRDDRSICVHAAFCTNKVTSVWKMVRAGIDDGEITSIIDRCPSGALTYASEPLLPESVAVIADGPLWVTGGVAITLPDGSELEPRNRVTLCRCGASNTKPLCDGTHREVQFRDA